ncbi:MAG: hypothetical protein U1E87_08190 [Alphaproteobacteria bacterium]
MRDLAISGRLTLAAIIGAAMAGAAPASGQVASQLFTFSASAPVGSKGFVPPTCPAGQAFRVSHIQASPDVGAATTAVFVAMGATPSGIGGPRWWVGVQLQQGSQPASWLRAWGTGWQHVETSTPGGQTLALPTKLQVHVAILGAPANSGALINFHVTGFCGAPSQT